jgi:IS1 family transposase
MRGSSTRYRCGHCARVFTSRTGTVYHRLRSGPERFDQLARMTIEGMSVASIARSLGISESTVRHWQKKAAERAALFNDTVIQDVPGEELQADEIKTFVERKERAAWVFTGVEVAARLWTSLLVGRRSRRDTRLHFRDLRDRMQKRGSKVYLATDGAPYFEPEVRKVFGPPCIYTQVEKSYDRGRIHRQSVRIVLGTKDEVEDALDRSEDSRVINTSFVERLNLTIRRMVAALQRKTTAFARAHERLSDALEMARCAYNFTRPHRSLRFGKECRTPAMQAGLVTRRLTFRDVFLTRFPNQENSLRERRELAAKRARLYHRAVPSKSRRCRGRKG